MNVDKKLETVCNLAKLDLTPEEKNTTQKDIERLLSFFRIMDEVNLADKESNISSGNVWREDIPSVSSVSFEQCGKVKDGMPVVPRTIGE